MNWFIITGEYPPQPGGLSDYTELVANGLGASRRSSRSLRSKSLCIACEQWSDPGSEDALRLWFG